MGKVLKYLTLGDIIKILTIKFLVVVIRAFLRVRQRLLRLRWVKAAINLGRHALFPFTRSRLKMRVKLTGARREMIVEMLRIAGWRENRQVDISQTERYYHEMGLYFSKGARAFYREFYGIAGEWFFDKYYHAWRAADLCFNLYPELKLWQDPRDRMYDDAEYTLKSREYASALEAAGEALTLVGEIGHYYPANVWIGGSGKIYATHDYNEIVYAFDTVAELIENEIGRLEFTYVTIAPTHYTEGPPPWYA